MKNNFKKQFKKWCKNNPYIFSKDLYTQLINVRNENKLKPWTIEKIIYMNTVNTNENNDEDNILLSGNELLEIKKIFTENNLIEEFEPFWFFMEDYVEYRKIGIKSLNLEFPILLKYWEWVKFIYNNNYSNFNEWIIIINNIIYKTQEGFKI